MTLEAPPPVKLPVTPRPVDQIRPANGNGHVGDGNGHQGGGHGHGGDEGGGTGWPGEAPTPDPRFPGRRRSFWPFMLDLGLALALFGLIITGKFLIVIGLVIFVVALTGWIREARAEYTHLKD
jgi:hypothetical protein